MSARVREYTADTMKQIEMQYSHGSLDITIRGNGYSEFAAIQTAIGVLLAEAWNMSPGLACDAVPEEIKAQIAKSWWDELESEVEEECASESASASEEDSSRV